MWQFRDESSSNQVLVVGNGVADCGKEAQGGQKLCSLSQYISFTIHARASSELGAFHHESGE
jgi:hypothetical protein